MKKTNVYAQDLENYLKAVNNLNIRRNNVRVVTKGIKLSRKQFGISHEPTVDDTLRILGEFDTVRLEMIERIEKTGILGNPEIVKEIKKAGFADSEDFLTTAKSELVGQKDEGALKRVLMRGERDRMEAKRNGDYFVELDSDMFHPMGRIDESEIGQAINVRSVKQLVRSFK